MLDDEMRADISEMMRNIMNEMHEGNEDNDDNDGGEAPKPDIKALREELYGSGRKLSNREYVEKTLELRDAIIAGGGEDPFLPKAHNYLASAETKNASLQVAEGLKHCVEVANGSDEYFDAELARIMRDTAPITARKAVGI